MKIKMIFKICLTFPFEFINTHRFYCHVIAWVESVPGRRPLSVVAKHSMMKFHLAHALLTVRIQGTCTRN
jgi:hypothetical protein